MIKPDFKKALQQKAKFFNTNKDVYLFYKNLEQIVLNKQVKGIVLLHSVTRTLDNMESLVKSMEKETCIPMSDSYREFTEKVRELYVKHSNGETITNEQGASFYDVSKNQALFDEDLKSLNEEYKEVIEQREKEEKEWIDFMNEPFTEKVPLKKVSPDKVSKDDIEGNEVFLILYPLFE